MWWWCGGDRVCCRLRSGIDEKYKEFNPRDVQDEETGVRRLVVPAGSGHIARQTITGGIKSRLGHTGSVKARLGLEREEEENR